MTLNAAWTGSAWVRDSAAVRSGGFRFGRDGFAFLHDDQLGPGFADFARQWALRLSGAAEVGFEAQGPARSSGHLALRASNPASAAATVSAGDAVTFRARLGASPSSVTLAPKVTSNFQGVPNVVFADRDGFSVASQQTLAPGATASWHGTFVAEA